jgi:hypothetical protein
MRRVIRIEAAPHGERGYQSVSALYQEYRRDLGRALDRG